MTEDKIVDTNNQIDSKGLPEPSAPEKELQADMKKLT